MLLTQQISYCTFWVVLSSQDMGFGVETSVRWAGLALSWERFPHMAASQSDGQRPVPEPLSSVHNGRDPYLVEGQ